MSKPARIFIMYAREDAAIRDELIKALSPLQLRQWVESWHDGNIEAGELWDEKIRHNLETADIVLPIISNDFFSSEYIQKIEIERAFVRFNAGRCRIVPIIARACAWESDKRLSELQVLPSGGIPIGSWSNRDEALKNIVTAIKRLVQPGDAPISSPNVPSEEVEILPLWKKYRMALIVPVILFVVSIIGLGQRYFAQDGNGDPTISTSPEKVNDKEIIDFEKAIGLHSIPAIHAFLQQYPNGSKGVDALEAIQTLQAELDFNVASALQLYEGGELKDATDAYNKAFRINPDDPEVQKLLQKLKKNH